MSTDANKGGRRRGRPIVAAEDDDEALKARRQRNREAQLTFRRRRLAASQQQEQRTKRLEQIVEEMSTCFTRFTDDMLRHEAVLRHEGLVSTLKGTMEEILSLAQEVVGADEEQEGSQGPAEEGESSRQDGRGTTVLGTPSMTGPSSSGSHVSDTVETFRELSFPPRHSSITSDSSRGMSLVPATNHNQATVTAFDPSLLFFPQQQQQQSSVPRIISPARARENRQYRNVYAPYTPEALTSDASFYFESFLPRLIQESLAKGYVLLQAVATTASTPQMNSALQRAFGATLQVASLTEVLEHLQYLLGPGRDSQSKMYNIAMSNVSPDSLVAASLASGAALSGRPPAENFVNALGVSRRLTELGARLVDPDTLELQIQEPSPRPQRVANPVRLSSSVTSSASIPNAQPPSWSYIDFFPTSASAVPRATTTVRVSVSLLINNLSSAAVCLEVGPGYPRHRLGEVVEASVIGMPGDGNTSLSANIPISAY